MSSDQHCLDLSGEEVSGASMERKRRAIDTNEYAKRTSSNGKAAMECSPNSTSRLGYKAW